MTLGPNRLHDGHHHLDARVSETNPLDVGNASSDNLGQPDFALCCPREARTFLYLVNFRLHHLCVRATQHQRLEIVEEVDSFLALLAHHHVTIAALGTEALGPAEDGCGHCLPTFPRWPTVEVGRSCVWPEKKVDALSNGR